MRDEWTLVKEYYLAHEASLISMRDLLASCLGTVALEGFLTRKCQLSNVGGKTFGSKIKILQFR
jgi:hypothetical protein